MKHYVLDYHIGGKVLGLSIFAKSKQDLDLCIKATLFVNGSGLIYLLRECYSTQVFNVEPSKFN